MSHDKHDKHAIRGRQHEDDRSERSKGRHFPDRPRIYKPATPLPVVSSAPLSVPADARHLVSVLLDIIEESAPMPASHRQDIRRDILDLWRELTSEKQDRKADYIGEPARLAAYLRYFLPWNVVRLIPILASLDLDIKAGDAILDIGSGPLTLPIALWIARPELRDKHIKLVAMDRVKRVLEAGTAILDNLRLRAGVSAAWTVEGRKGAFPFDLSEEERESYALISSANVFNESFWKGKGRLDARARALALELGLALKPEGSLLVVEPGDPRTGAMIASLREAIIRGGGTIQAPCPHHAACPMPGAFMSSAYRDEETDDDEAERDEPVLPPLERVVSPRGRVKAPWCHFALPQDAAPERLEKFSASVGLPKDRLVASFLYAKPHGGAPSPRELDKTRPPALRIVSDAFRLPDGGYARYACSRTGYSIVRGALADLPSGAFAVLGGPLPGSNGQRDQKSGAVIVLSPGGVGPSAGSRSSFGARPFADHPQRPGKDTKQRSRETDGEKHPGREKGRPDGNAPRGQAYRKENKPDQAGKKGQGKPDGRRYEKKHTRPKKPS